MNGLEPYDGYDDYANPYGGEPPASSGIVSPQPPDSETTDEEQPGAAGMHDPRRLDDCCGDIELFDPTTSHTYPYYGYERPPEVAVFREKGRVSHHPLGLAAVPPGVAGSAWQAMDADAIIRDTTPVVAPELRGIPATETVPGPDYSLPYPEAVGGGYSGGGGTPEPPSEAAGGKKRKDSTEMPFLDHLEELRWVILKTIVIVVIGMLASWYLSDWFYKQITGFTHGGKSLFTGKPAPVTLVMEPVVEKRNTGQIVGFVKDKKGKGIAGATVTVTPGAVTATTDSTGRYVLRDIEPGNYTISANKNGFMTVSKRTGMNLVMTTIMEPLMIRLQMALVMGIVLTLPFVFYFIWSFVSPGLYQNEKQWVLPMIFASTGCFIVGISIAWYIVIPYMLPFLLAFMPDDAQDMFTFSRFMGFILKVALSFGIIFELPVITFVLAKIGLIKYQWMAKYRGYAVIFIFIAAAIITPTVDPVSQTLMAVPMYLLYEISIIVARIAGRRTII